MSSTTYDWFTVDDNDDLEGDGTVSVGSIHTHGGRTGRNASIVLTTTDNVQAVISVVQGGAEEQIQIEQLFLSHIIISNLDLLSISSNLLPNVLRVSCVLVSTAPIFLFNSSIVLVISLLILLESLML